MPATCVPQYVPRANTGLSKHEDPVLPHFWSWNQNLARVCARWGGAQDFEGWCIFVNGRVPKNLPRLGQPKGGLRGAVHSWGGGGALQGVFTLFHVAHGFHGAP